MDHAVVERFARERGPALRTFLYRRVFDFGAAEDLMQQALLRALLVEREVPGTQAEVERYIFRIAANLIFDRKRDGWSRLVDRDYDIAERPIDRAEAAVDDTVEAVEAILALVKSPAQRTALRMQIIDELSLEMIAKRMDCPPGKVKTLVFRGRNSIRRSVRRSDLHG